MISLLKMACKFKYLYPKNHMYYKITDISSYKVKVKWRKNIAAENTCNLPFKLLH